MVQLVCRHRPSLVQMTARKQLRKHIRRIRDREYSKLRALVPAIAKKKKVTKVQVIEETVRYIEELHFALLERFRKKHGDRAENMAEDTIRSFVTRLEYPPQQVSTSPHSINSGQQRLHDFTLLSPLPVPSPSAGFQIFPSTASDYMPEGLYEKHQRRPSFLLLSRRKTE